MTSFTLIEHSTAHARVPPAPRLRLLPSGDGWSLVTDDGRLVFSALGWSGRRRCLAYAHATGVVALVS